MGYQPRLGLSTIPKPGAKAYRRINMDYENHEAADIFPLDKQHIGELAKDIRKHGLLEPIELFKEKVLDGRRRLLACEQAGVEPDYCDVSIPDPVAYVLSKNLHRRHLTNSQRAMVAAKADKLWAKYRAKAKERQGERSDLTLGPPGPKVKHHRTRDDVGKVFDISGRSADRGRTVVKKGIPEVVEAVENKSVSIAAAEEIVRLSKKEQPRALEEAIRKDRKSTGAKKKDEPHRRKVAGVEVEGIGVIEGHNAINCLKKIPKNDPTGKRGYQIVRDFMRHNPMGVKK